jgi:hypothetical protein
LQSCSVSFDATLNVRFDKIELPLMNNYKTNVRA